MHRHALDFGPELAEAKAGFGAPCSAEVLVSNLFLLPQALLTAAEAERYVDALRTFTLIEASTHIGGLIITKLISPSCVILYSSMTPQKCVHNTVLLP